MNICHPVCTLLLRSAGKCHDNFSSLQTASETNIGIRYGIHALSITQKHLHNAEFITAALASILANLR